jgi:predicted GH43/DUF377 family glycosyl hydrolase
MTCLPQPDGNVFIYYGAADAVICLAEAPISALVRHCTAI